MVNPKSKGRKQARNRGKAFERRVAKALGTQRVVCSGVRGEGDVEHDEYHIECKSTKQYRINEWWKDAREKARRSGKTPLLAVHHPGEKTNLVILRLEDFAELIG